MDDTNILATTKLTSSLKVFLKEYSDANTAGLVDAAPHTLDTLNELARALGDDPNFATTVANQIATKIAKSSISTSVASTSKVNVASSSAVKSAYDKGVLGVNNASTAQEKADSAYILASGKLGSTSKAADSSKLDGNIRSQSSYGNTIAQRNSDGGLTVKNLILNGYTITLEV